jgi:exopolysaccharide biosynthesis polyprenyl glycosylphosphotransferase
MLAARRQTLIKAYKFFDLLVMACSFALAAWGSFSLQNGTIPFEEFLSMRIKVQNFVFFLGFLVVWRFIFSGFGTYGSRRLASRIKESLDLLKATSLGTLILFSAALLFHLTMVTPMFLLIFWAATSFICILSRLLLRRFLGWLRVRGRNLRYMLIVGTNERAMRFAKEIESQPELGYRILGFVENGWKGNGDFNLNGYRIVSDFKSFPSFIRENAVDEVILCLPIKSFYDQISAISMQCEEQGIIVRHLSDLFDLKLAHSKSGSLEGEPLISHFTGAMEGWQVQVKRMIDILLSSISLLALSPVFLFVSLLIKITSPGPVFFVQERVGLNKRRFRLYKFRTMSPDADKRQAELEDLNEVTGPVFKIKNDPRITTIGKVLRKTSIDELPQLYNVLKGDMSLVGPRALPVRDYNGFSQDWHRRRFSVRPGITCLWQVNGRSAIPFEQWMELDIEYIDTWSLWLDLRILFRTIPAVLKGSGAA